MTVILRYGSLHLGEVGVVGRAHRDMVADRVTTDDETAGVYARIPYSSLQHLGILDGIGLCRHE